MALDDLPGAMIVPQHDDVRTQYLRDVRIRTPGAVTIEGTKEFADAEVFADQMSPVYFDAKNIGDFVALVNKAGQALADELTRQTGSGKLPAAGATGFVRIKASVGGGTIQSGDEIKDNRTGLRFQCTATGLYLDGGLVPIAGIDTGPLTDIAANSAMTWTTPRPGIAPTAVVIAQTDGSGLSGGRDEESDGDAIERLISLRASPPASGNDSEYRSETQKAPAITIQQAFTYPAILGAGTIGVTFTLRPAGPGGSRIPNPAQLSAAAAYLIGRFPADDSILMCTLLPSPVTLLFKVTWAPTAVSWADPAPWPPYNSSSPVAIDDAVSITATSFRLTTATEDTVAPQVGQTIAFYDQPSAVFRRKKIAAVSEIISGRSWDITVDQTNNSSDLTYVPVAAQVTGPWSDSLAGLVTPITNYFDLIGPGEQIDPLPDPALRQRRTPRSPGSYANSVTNRVVSNLFELSSVGDIELVSPIVPYYPTVGTPGVASYLLTLGSIAVFVQ